MKTLALLTALMALWAIQAVQAGEFFCQSGDVTCLISAINKANNKEGQHTITLEPGLYTLQTLDNTTDGPNGLPSIKRFIHIKASADDPPTVIERDPGAQGFRIFHIAVGGELSLEGVTAQRGFGVLLSGPAIFNRGVTSLVDSIIKDSMGEAGAIHNVGTLNVFRSIIADNILFHLGGGIRNESGGNVLVENSTITHNVSADGGGIENASGSLIVRNSAIIFNSTDSAQPGGGIFNNAGYVEIVNSTIANNGSGFRGGGGVANLGGQVSITNSTIRENKVHVGNGGGIANLGGSVRLQNTIVAGNDTIVGGIPGGAPFAVGPDCFGSITSLGNNLFGDPSDCDVNLQSTDLTGKPGLDALVGTGEQDSPGRAYYPVLAGSVVLNSGNAAACPSTDQLGNPRVGNCDIGAIESQDKLLVSVDVRPRGDANKINPNSTKTINVAIFSGNGFDATTIDPNTVRFGATGNEATPIHVGRRDVDADGERDIVLRFQIQDTGISCGDTSALLTGQIAGGASIMGSTPIKTVQCKQKKRDFVNR